MFARACGKNDVHDLEPEDLRAMTIEASAITGIPLVGTNFSFRPESFAQAMLASLQSDPDPSTKRPHTDRCPFCSAAPTVAAPRRRVRVRRRGDHAADLVRGRAGALHVPLLPPNAVGPQREWWFHSSGCREWFQAERDTRDNTVIQVARPGGCMAARACPSTAAS